MDGHTATGKERLRLALDAAHEAVQEAHARLYDVELACERVQNDALASGAYDPSRDEVPYAAMRTEITELRPLVVPIARWLQKQRRAEREASTHGS